MARGRLRLPLRQRLPTDTGVDFPMEATDALTEATDFPMVATDALTVDTVDMVATDVASMARGRLRLPLRQRLPTDTGVDFPMEATDALTEATDFPMVATDA